MQKSDVSGTSKQKLGHLTLPSNMRLKDVVES